MNHSHHPSRLPSRRQILAGALGLGSLAALAPLHIARAADYRALVCIFLYGGTDGNNMIVPMDATRYGQYQAIRGPLALPQGSLGRLGTTDYGLHPSLAALNPIYAAGQLAAQLNVGPLYAPLTKAAYLADAGRTAVTPPSLFSHSDQQTLWEAGSTDKQSRTGWGGRAAAALGMTNPVISVGGNGRFGLSDLAVPLVLPSPGDGFGAYGLRDADVTWTPNLLRRNAVDALYAQTPDSALAGAYQSQQSNAFALSRRLGTLVERAPGSPGSNAAIDAAFAPLISDGVVNSYLGRQLYQVAKLIDGRATVGGDRQIFFAQLGGFDTHSEQIGGSSLDGTHAGLLKGLGDAMAAFNRAMQAIGMGASVTTFTQSDFGRTLAPNSTSGSDHAWGNHHLVMGGAVKVGVHGAYPTLALGGPDDVGVEAWELQGRWIPSRSVDQYAATLLRWVGASEAQLDSLLPNLRNFGSARSLPFL